MKRNYTVDATEKEFYGITEKKQRLIFGSFGYQDTSSDSSSEIVFHREQETDLAGESSNEEAKRDN
ncbi:hypothetical protein O9G_005683 [Rozella allomycis CSF55]|uniref:Uncharacterized protein n=1 Tax=Rozella allomycis (strain CSF55) TaxID=988480 RepID=A0A075ARG5_ROZAC|nr:hypothetical protein O9G_005683 [Rozella allomycis CSF55]|eukprot:EPZ32838.1 hypothetical protein O9G_005683 [Rozella allomycis CSF55]